MGSFFGNPGRVNTKLDEIPASTLTNDCVLRSRTGNNLILQSGGGGAAAIINSGNNVIITGTQLILNTASGNNQLYINSSISTANNAIQFKNNN